MYNNWTFESFTYVYFTHKINIDNTNETFEK